MDLNDEKILTFNFLDNTGFVTNAWSPSPSFFFFKRHIRPSCFDKNPPKKVSLADDSQYPVTSKKVRLATKILGICRANLTLLCSWNKCNICDARLHRKYYIDWVSFFYKCSSYVKENTPLIFVIQSYKFLRSLEL